MKQGLKITILSLTLLLSLYVILGTAFLMNGWGVLMRCVLYVAGSAGVIAGVLFFALKKDALSKTAFILVCLVALVFTVIVILNYTAHLNELESDQAKIERLTDLIRGAGGWAMAVYILIQILQVVILPLPALVCYLPGAMIWNPGIATLLASAGVLIGTLICYFLGRVFGRRVVEWIAGKESCDKYADVLGKRGKVLFVLMQILPFFPDDILCLVAGLTKMSFPFFLVTMILVRPAIIAVYCYFGGGSVIPYSGWGIPVWIAIFAVCITLAVLSFKYQDKFEGWLKSKFGGKKEEASLTAGESAQSVESVEAESNQSPCETPQNADEPEEKPPKQS